MSAATSTPKVETLHPRPARQPAAVPRKRKAKATIVPLHGWQNLDNILQHGLVNARATLGLANGLHELFSIRLADAEQDLTALGRRTSDGDGSRYAQQIRRTEDLRTWVGVLAALKERAFWAESSAEKAAERVGHAARRGGDHAP